MSETYPAALAEVTESEVIAALIPDTPAALCDPPATQPMPKPLEQPEPIDTTQPITVYRPVVQLLPAQPEPALDFERGQYWDTGSTLLVLALALGVGIVGMVGYYVVYPVVMVVATVVGAVGNAGALVGALALVAVGLYWATALLGFWDHPKVPTPGVAALPQPGRVGAGSAPVMVQTPVPPVVAHLVGRRGSACGADMTGASTARRGDPRCPACLAAEAAAVGMLDS